MTKKIKSEKINNKSSKKYKNITETRRDSHILAVKSTLKNILYSKKTDEKFEEYNENKYSDYITKMFNSSIIHMLIVYFNKNNSQLKKYQYDKEQNFINKFANLIKELYLNEMEVAYLTLLLDKFGWDFENYKKWDYFYCLGLYCKKNVSGEIECDNLLRKSFDDQYSLLKKNLEDQYCQLVNEQKFDDFEKERITNKELNERFKELTKPISSYCRKDFINYNGIADKIVRLSQPYGIESNGNQLINVKNANNNKDNNTINMEQIKKIEENDYSKMNNNISNINNDNNYDFNKINNLVSSFPYNNINNIRNNTNINTFNNRSAFSNNKHELNLQPNNSQLSLERQKSGNSFYSNSAFSYHHF